MATNPTQPRPEQRTSSGPSLFLQVPPDKMKGTREDQWMLFIKTLGDVLMKELNKPQGEKTPSPHAPDVQPMLSQDVFEQLMDAMDPTRHGNVQPPSAPPQRTAPQATAPTSKRVTPQFDPTLSERERRYYDNAIADSRSDLRQNYPDDYRVLRDTKELRPAGAQQPSIERLMRALNDLIR